MVLPIFDTSLLLDLAMIVVFTAVIGYIVKYFKQPMLLAYLITGILLGPQILGSFGFDLFGLGIGINNMKEIMVMSELGIAFLLFGVGVDTDLRKMSGLTYVIVIGTIVQVAVTAAVVFFTSQMLGMLSFEESIYLGLILAFSSTLIVVKLLADSRTTNTLHGRLMIGFLLVQDFLVILAMPVLAEMQSGNPLQFAGILSVVLEGIALIALAYILAKFVYPQLYSFAHHSSELLYLAAISSCFIFIYLAHVLGFSIAIGAFIGGLALSALPYNLEVLNKISGLKDFFAAIFFVTLGMQISFDFLGFPIVILLLIIALAFIIKPLIYYFITLFSGFGGRISVLVALGLAQVSEFSFILASQGYAYGTGVLARTPGLYSIIVLIISVSILGTPYLMGHSEGIYNIVDRFARKYFPHLKTANFLHKKINSLDTIPEHLSNHIVVAGCGTVGRGVVEILRRDHEVVVIDHDSNLVAELIEEGVNATYGDAGNNFIWERLEFEKAKLLVVAIPDAAHAAALIRYAKEKNPKLVAFGRASFYTDALKLYEHGADYVVMPKVVSSNVLLKAVVNFLDTGKPMELDAIGIEYLDYIRDKAKEEKTRIVWQGHDMRF